MAWLPFQKIKQKNYRQRQENAARAVERDRLHWESVQKNWHATTEADKAHVEMRHKVTN